jgi:two-component system, sensor histidine kinase and response regulator
MLSGEDRKTNEEPADTMALNIHLFRSSAEWLAALWGGLWESNPMAKSISTEAGGRPSVGHVLLGGLKELVLKKCCPMPKTRTDSVAAAGDGCLMKPTPVHEVNQASCPGGAQASASAAGLAPALIASNSTKAAWDKAEALDRLGGDEELLRELCGIFLAESPKLLQKLRQAIVEADVEGVMRAAHSLKGELGYLGAEAAVQAARQLEDMGHEKNLLNAAEVFALLEREFAGLHAALKDFAGATR